MGSTSKAKKRSTSMKKKQGKRVGKDISRKTKSGLVIRCKAAGQSRDRITVKQLTAASGRAIESRLWLISRIDALARLAKMSRYREGVDAPAVLTAAKTITASAGKVVKVMQGMEDLFAKGQIAGANAKFDAAVEDLLDSVNMIGSCIPAGCMLAYYWWEVCDSLSAAFYSLRDRWLELWIMLDHLDEYGLRASEEIECLTEFEGEFMLDYLVIVASRDEQPLNQEDEEDLQKIYGEDAGNPDAGAQSVWGKG